MSYQINKVGVIGSGTMGAGIAALLAGIDVPVVVMDIPMRDTEPGDRNRNAIIDNNMKALQKASRSCLLGGHGDGTAGCRLHLDPR